MTRSQWLLPVVLFGLSACAQTEPGAFEFPDGVQQYAVPAGKLPWRPCPANLPPGCELAVLEGNPQAAGLFTARFRLAEGFVMPPHTHPRDERVTVVSGRMAVAFGRDATHADARQFGPGDYYVNAPNAIHHVWADELSEIQITGFGPWEADFIE